MDKLENIKLFLLVSQFNSFTVAANKLNIGQGTVSKNIAKLEQQLGFTLFHRHSRSVQITPQGAEYLEHCQQMMDELTNVESKIKDERDIVKGTLKLSIPSAMATKILAKPIASFMELHPEIEINVSVNDRQVNLVEEYIDVAIRASNLDDSGYKARYLFNNKAIFCASPEYLNKHLEPASPTELINHSCLTYSLLDRPNKWSAFNDTSKQTFIVNQHFSSDSPEMLLTMAVAGQGVIALPDWMVKPYIDNGKLIHILKSYTHIDLPMYAVFKSDNYLPIRIKAFIDHLAVFFQTDPKT